MSDQQILQENLRLVQRGPSQDDVSAKLLGQQVSYPHFTPSDTSHHKDNNSSALHLSLVKLTQITDSSIKLIPLPGSLLDHLKHHQPFEPSQKS